MPAPGLDGPPDNFVGNPAVGLVAEDPLVFKAAEVVAQEAAARRDISVSQRASHFNLSFRSRKGAVERLGRKLSRWDVRHPNLSLA